MDRLSHPPRAALALIVLLAALAGCAVPASSPTYRAPVDPTTPEDPSPATPESAFEREISALLADGQGTVAASMLRERLASGSGDEDPHRLRLLLARALLGSGETFAAEVEYALVAGSSDRSGDVAAAWGGIAEARSRAGDALGAARAGLRAWESAANRDEWQAPSERAVQSLSTADLRHLERQLRGRVSHAFARLELDERRAATGDSGEVTVAILAPMSGRFEQFGAAFRLGAELALAERPESARPALRVVVRDSRGDLAVSVREARAAIVEDEAMVLLGPLLSGPALAAGAVAEAEATPLIAPTATDPAIRTAGRHVLPLEPDPSELAVPLAEFATDRLGARRFGALVPDDGSSAELERHFRDAVETRGGRIVESLVYPPDATDFRKLLERFQDANVDAVYFPGPAATLEALAPQLEFYEYDRRVLGHGGWTSPRVRDPRNLALTGAVLAVTEAEDPESEFMSHVRDRVLEATGEEVSRFHVRGWQAMETVLAALDAGARTRETLVEVLALRRHWEGRPRSERLRLLTVRTGELVPADVAVQEGLNPLSERPQEDEDEKDADEG